MPENVLMIMEDGMSVEMRWDDGVAVHSVSGNVTMREVLRYVSETKDLWIGADVLWDVSEARVGSLTLGEWTGLFGATEEIGKLRAGRRTALVSQVDLHLPMLKLLSGVARSGGHPAELKAFDNVLQAMEWLRRER